jgi:arylformamidase
MPPDAPATYDGYSTADEFDAGYDNFITPDVVARWDAIFRADSERVLANFTDRVELRYGNKERNGIDFFPAAGADENASAPLLIAIHGGLWFLFDKWFMHFLAEAYTARGVHVACVNYGLAPGQDLNGIVDDCRRAVAYLHREAPALRIDPSHISVLGHSAAGQLATIVAATTWQDYSPAAPRQILHGCIGVSGFYDIEPFAQTHFQDFTKFPVNQYRAWNPLRNISPANPTTLLITGARESSLLQQMMWHYADGLRACSVPVDTICAGGECHFSVLHEIGNSASPLFQRVLQLVRGV